MTDLYKEALLEARKLKEIAEEDAKKSIIEALSPYVKKIITKQINESTNQEFIFNEEEEQPMETGLELDSPDLGDQDMSAPIEDPNSVNVELPSADSDGKLVVDVDSLFITEPTAPVEPELEVSPEQPEESDQEIDLQNQVPTAASTNLQNLSESYSSWKNMFLETSEKIDKVYFSNKTPKILSESLKEKLFVLLESLDQLKEKGLIKSEQAKINENKLEFLFIKLKEANLNNSYLKKDQKEEQNMTSLKEYAAKLFAESFSEESENEVNQDTTASAKHAAKMSGVSPEVDLTEEMDVQKSEEQWADAEPTLDEKDQDKVIEEALAALEEEVEAEGHAGFGDTDEEPCVEPMLEVDEMELQEAIKQIKKESIKKKMAKLKEEKTKEGDQGSAKPVGGDDSSKKNLEKPLAKSNLSPVEELMAEESDMEGMDMLDDGEDESFGFDEDDDADLVLDINLPDEVEDALADVDVDVLKDIQVSLGDVNLGDDEAGEVEEPEAGEEPSDDMEDKELLVDDENEEPEAGVEDDMAMEMNLMKESVTRSQAKNKLLEAKLNKTVKLASNLKKEVSGLKAELQEANLFIAKNVYFTKFLQRGDLSKSNLTKIVEHLDRARNVQEAKEIYTKIKTKLAESAAASKKLTGSSSKVTRSGSAVSLNESVVHEDGLVIDPKRWQKLANIKTNDE